jgi:hypothetical protein
MGLGICLFCQDTGSFTDQEFYALTNNCDTVGVGKCADHDGKAMAAVTLHPRGNTYKDWEEPGPIPSMTNWQPMRICSIPCLPAERLYG